eukprot:360578-Chlamydomonas_euryale.AAC.26
MPGVSSAPAAECDLDDPHLWPDVPERSWHAGAGAQHKGSKRCARAPARHPAYSFLKAQNLLPSTPCKHAAAVEEFLNCTPPGASVGASGGYGQSAPRGTRRP